MAKELPYFKFEPNEYITGTIQDCSLETQGAFINMCCLYWSRLGKLSYATALRRCCDGNADLMRELCDSGVLSVIEDDIIIKFLEDQLSEFKILSDKNRLNAIEGWKKRRKYATALRPHCETDAIREEKRREENKIPSFDDFFIYAKNKKSDFDKDHLRLKYDSWIENGWKDGNGKKIKNWKSKLLNTLPHLKTQTLRTW